VVLDAFGIRRPCMFTSICRNGGKKKRSWTPGEMGGQRGIGIMISGWEREFQAQQIVQPGWLLYFLLVYFGIGDTVIRIHRFEAVDVQASLPQPHSSSATFTSHSPAAGRLSYASYCITVAVASRVI